MRSQLCGMISERGYRVSYPQWDIIQDLKRFLEEPEGKNIMMGIDPRALRTRDGIELDQRYIVQTYRRPHFVLERGEGAYLYDIQGERYLDFVAGLGVNALGYGDEEVIETIKEQASKLIHVSNLYHTMPGAELASMLVELTRWSDQVFFCNSGSEAVEGAIKMARRYARAWAGNVPTNKTALVAFEGSFHGRTMGALAVTSREQYRIPFEPMLPGVRFAPFDDIESLEEFILVGNVCAVIVEPIQGEGGVRPASNEFLHRLRKLCYANRSLLILDEVQCGMGRTGSLWAHESAGSMLQPDIMTVAKPLAGGLPIGAILVRRGVAETLKVGEHGSTFGGGPLVTAVAQVVLRRVSEPSFLEHVQRVGAVFEQALKEFKNENPKHILDVRGRGLMLGMQIKGNAMAFREYCLWEGLLVAIAGPDVIRFLPPLIITEEHVAEAMQKLRTAWKRFQR